MQKSDVEKASIWCQRDGS